jgi:hypothetical protein
MNHLQKKLRPLRAFLRGTPVMPLSGKRGLGGSLRFLSRQPLQRKSEESSYLEFFKSEESSDLGATERSLADQIHGIPLIWGLCPLGSLRPSPFQFRRYRSELIENIVDKL